MNCLSAAVLCCSIWSKEREEEREAEREGEHLHVKPFTARERNKGGKTDCVFKCTASGEASVIKWSCDIGEKEHFQHSSSAAFSPQHYQHQQEFLLRSARSRGAHAGGKLRDWAAGSLLTATLEILYDQIGITLSAADWFKIKERSVKLNDEPNCVRLSSDWLSANQRCQGRMLIVCFFFYILVLRVIHTSFSFWQHEKKKNVLIPKVFSGMWFYLNFPTGFNQQHINWKSMMPHRHFLFFWWSVHKTFTMI